MLQFCATVKPIHQSFPFEGCLSQPSLAGSGGQTVEERLAYIRSLAGKYMDCEFSTERLFKERQHAKNMKMQNGYIVDACALLRLSQK